MSRNAWFQQCSTTQGGVWMVWAAPSWYSIGHIITVHSQTTAREYVDGLSNHIPRSRRYLRTMMQFSMTTMPISTLVKLFIHGLKSMKVNFNIFRG
jgi:hypothetical protein